MNYELAKKLKDVGFPQFTMDTLKPLKGHYEFSGRVVKNEDWDTVDKEKILYIPTLSELIEQIKKEFPHLQWRLRVDVSGFVIERYNWPDMRITETSEESVSNLYLELHKNDPKVL